MFNLTMIIMTYIENLISEYLPEAMASFAKNHKDIAEGDFNLEYADSEDIAREMMQSTFESKIERSSWEEMENVLSGYIYDHKVDVINIIRSFISLYYI